MIKLFVGYFFIKNKNVLFLPSQYFRFQMFFFENQLDFKCFFYEVQSLKQTFIIVFS